VTPSVEVTDPLPVRGVGSLPAACDGRDVGHTGGMSECEKNVGGEEGGENTVLPVQMQAVVDQLEAVLRDGASLADQFAARLQATNDRVVCKSIEARWAEEGE
jgi:hypothetical protein